MSSRLFTTMSVAVTFRRLSSTCGYSQNGSDKKNDRLVAVSPKSDQFFDQTPFAGGPPRTRPLWHSYSASSIMLTSPYPKRDIQAAVSPSAQASTAGGHIWRNKACT